MCSHETVNNTVMTTAAEYPGKHKHRHATCTTNDNTHTDTHSSSSAYRTHTESSSVSSLSRLILLRSCPVVFIISLYIVVFLCLVIPEAIQSGFKHCIVVAATTFSRKLFRTLTALCVKVYFHTSSFDIVLYSLR